MDEVGVPQAAFVGAGEGGPTCMLFPATFPERTSALVLAAPFFVRAWAPDVPWGITPAAAEGILRAIARKWGREPMGINAFTPSLVGDPAYVEWYLRAQRAGGTPAAARAWFETLLPIGRRRILPASNVPTLVLPRVDDRVLSVESSRFAASHIPGARLVELPGN